MGWRATGARVALLWVVGSTTASAAELRVQVPDTALGRDLAPRLARELGAERVVVAPGPADLVVTLAEVEGALQLRVQDATALVLERRFSLEDGRPAALRKVVFALARAARSPDAPPAVGTATAAPARDASSVDGEAGAGAGAQDGSGERANGARELPPDGAAGGGAPHREPEVGVPVDRNAATRRDRDDGTGGGGVAPPRGAGRDGAGDEASPDAGGEPPRGPEAGRVATDGAPPRAPGATGDPAEGAPSPEEPPETLALGVGPHVTWAAGAPQLGLSALLAYRLGPVRVGVHGAVAGVCCTGTSDAADGEVALEGDPTVWSVAGRVAGPFLTLGPVLLGPALEVGVEQVRLRVTPVIFAGPAPSTDTSSTGLVVRAGAVARGRVTGRLGWRFDAAVQVRAAAPEVSLPAGFPTNAAPLGVGRWGPALAAALELDLF